uniref:Uncharacterized protein n=2 Tax=Capitella teleta TaxID=283909 RepID=X2AD74_CAPTE
MSKQDIPQLDWTPDAKLPTRFKAWKAEIEDEIILFEDPKSPHLRPLWFSERHDSSIHLVEAEVDSGAGCNTFPLYLYRKIFGAAPLEPPSVVIKAFGDQPIRNLGCKVLFFQIGKQILQKKFQVCDVRKNPIIGRDLSAEMGYITFPPITEPHLSYRPTIQKIYTISSKAETTENITDVKRPVVQKQTKNQVPTGLWMRLFQWGWAVLSDSPRGVGLDRPITEEDYQLVLSGLWRFHDESRTASSDSPSSGVVDSGVKCAGDALHVPNRPPLLTSTPMVQAEPVARNLVGFLEMPSEVPRDPEADLWSQPPASKTVWKDPKTEPRS